MAIIIPSSNIYSLENNKIIDNKIDGVSYAQTSIVDKTGDLWTLASTSASATSSTFNIYGEYSLVSSTKRQRVKVAITTAKRTTNASGYTTPLNMDWDKAYWQFAQNLTDNLTNTTSKYLFVLAAKMRGKEPKPPTADVGDNALKSYAKQLWKYGIGADIAEETDPSAIVYCYSKIILQIITETLTSGSWEQTSTRTLYNSSATLYSGTSSDPAIRLYLDNSIDDNSTIAIGNEKSAYSLPSNDLFTESAEISGKTLGTYVSEKIIEDYANGKETAEVLCSISNYYDVFGNQVKFDNAENMTFDIYDEVLPMKYTPNGEDVPMSITNYGTAKTFVVLGAEIFYDGAVWQKLTLMEFGEILTNKLAAPDISIANDFLYIQTNDTRAESFDILLDGVVVRNITETTFDLTQLLLDYGIYKVTVIAKADNYYDSYPSNSVDYSYFVKLDAPKITLDDYILTINDNSQKAKQAMVFISNVGTVTKNLFNGSVSLDLSNYIILSGTYSIYAIVTSPDYYNSNSSNVVKYVLNVTDGLKYGHRISSETVYYCMGIGTATDTDIIIAKVYKGERVEGIYTNAFAENKNITSVTIPYGITRIESQAFYSCTRLSRVEIPNSVVSLGRFAFSGTALTSINIPGSIRSWGDSCFTSCQSLTKATIEYGVTKIPDSMFYNCWELIDVVIPNSVTSIGNSAFERCTSLASIEIPSSVTSIGNSAFRDCTSLTDIYVPWSEGEVLFAPWGAPNATIHYNSEV